MEDEAEGRGDEAGDNRGGMSRLVGIGLVQDVLDSLVDGVDGVGILVRDLNAEFLLNGHDDLDGVEAVKAEVVGEVGSGLDVGGVVDLVKTGQQANDAALDLLLVQATGGAVHADGDEAGDAGDSGRGDAREGNLGGASGGTNGSAGRSRGDGAEHGGAEHDCGLVVELEEQRIKGGGSGRSRGVSSAWLRRKRYWRKVRGGDGARDGL
jgi:hypothetical protein